VVEQELFRMMIQGMMWVILLFLFFYLSWYVEKLRVIFGAFIMIFFFISIGVIIEEKKVHGWIAVAYGIPVPLLDAIAFAIAYRSVLIEERIERGK
jgi:hypothetical protein